MFLAKDVRSGAELLLDYGAQYWGSKPKDG